MMQNQLEALAKAAKEASRRLAVLTTGQKNKFLLDLADLLEAETSAICAANGEDMQEARNAGLNEAMLDRLYLSPERVAGIAADVRHVAALDDPIGKVLDGRTLDNGLRLSRRRVPLGVVAAIYEARPNVTIDIATLCLKTGNAVVLRGGKETVRSNRVLVDLLKKCLSANGLPEEAAQDVADPDRNLLKPLLELDKYIDMLIPRGGGGLQRFCAENSRIPVITGGIGVCHIFVDATARQNLAIEVLANAKTQRPSVCNALETVIVHEDIAAQFIPLMTESLGRLGVSFHAGPRAFPYFPKPCLYPVSLLNNNVVLDKEWLSLDLNVVVASGVDEAIDYIAEHGSGHSDSILTGSMENAGAFVDRVDSAAVYVNASTRFTDGAQFGLGAEVAISTQKLHARGPIALEGLTTYKWIGIGDYTVRK